MTTKTIIHWNADDLASPALLDQLFDDCGLGKDDTLRPERPEQKELAREAAKNYFTDFIRMLGKGHSLTMGEVNTMAYVFYDAYLAGMANSVHPQRS